VRSTCHVLAGLVASAALLATGAPSAAAPKPITGKLSKPGYTLIALATDGTGKAVRAGRGRFTVAAPASRVTLHLRAPNGVYAGPIVVRPAAAGRRAIVGLKAGARLGGIRIRRGHAKVARRLARKWVDATRTARARRGVPIGVGVFGRVRSRPPGSFENPRRPEDLDTDGVPNVLDIDDDGDLVLDKIDGRPNCYRCSDGRRARSGSARAAQDPEQDPEVTDKFRTTSFLELELEQTVNANAPGLTPEQIAAALPRHGRLTLQISDRPLPAGAELDCAQPQQRRDPILGGLVYCSSDGTGRVFSGCPPPASECPFPGPRGSEPFDTDGDGFGTVTADPGGCPPAIQGCTPFMTLRHGASPDQIGTGDLLLLRASDHDRPAMLEFAFATTPALRSYDDGQGNSATISYPVTAPTPGPPSTPGGLGTRGNGFPVSAPLGQDVKVTLTFWRPQIRPIPPEPGAWVDVGGLVYRAVPQATPGAGPVDECPQGAYEDHPGLTLPGGESSPGLVDEAPNRPADPSNTLTFTLNLTQCLAARGLSFNPGEEHAFNFGARALNARDIAIQRVHFKRQ
jgi:hypothetical protein